MVATTLPPSPHAHAGADRTDPVASATYRPRRLNIRHCSCRWPDPAATATTRTVAAPTAAAGPTPARKYSDKFFLFFPSHLNLTGQWRPHHCRHLHLPHPHVGNPAHVPILPKPQPAAATTSSPPQPWPLQPPLPHLSSPQPPPPPPQAPCPDRHCPNCHRHPDSVPAAAPTAPLPPVSPDPHLQRHPSYTSTSSMY